MPQNERDDEQSSEGQPWRKAQCRWSGGGPLGQAAAAANRPGQLVQPGAGRKYGLNENYGRGLMEFHTLGVEGGYTQKDVIEVARYLTSWTIDCPNRGGEFIFRPRMHDDGEKTVLGHRVNGGGIRDGHETQGLRCTVHGRDHVE